MKHIIRFSLCCMLFANTLYTAIGYTNINYTPNPNQQYNNGFNNPNNFYNNPNLMNNTNNQMPQGRYESNNAIYNAQPVNQAGWNANISQGQYGLNNTAYNAQPVGQEGWNMNNIAAPLVPNQGPSYNNYPQNGYNNGYVPNSYASGYTTGYTPGYTPNALGIPPNQFNLSLTAIENFTKTLKNDKINELVLTYVLNRIFSLKNMLAIPNQPESFQIQQIDKLITLINSLLDQIYKSYEGENLTDTSVKTKRSLLKFMTSCASINAENIRGLLNKLSTDNHLTNTISMTGR